LLRLSKPSVVQGPDFSVTHEVKRIADSCLPGAVLTVEKRQLLCFVELDGEWTNSSAQVLDRQRLERPGAHLERFSTVFSTAKLQSSAVAVPLESFGSSRSASSDARRFSAIRRSIILFASWADGM